MATSLININLWGSKSVSLTDYFRLGGYQNARRGQKFGFQTNGICRCCKLLGSLHSYRQICTHFQTKIKLIIIIFMSLLPPTGIIWAAFPPLSTSNDHQQACVSPKDWVLNGFWYLALAILLSSFCNANKHLYYGDYYDHV